MGLGVKSSKHWGWLLLFQKSANLARVIHFQFPVPGSQFPVNCQRPNSYDALNTYFYSNKGCQQRFDSLVHSQVSAPKKRARTLRLRSGQALGHLAPSLAGRPALSVLSLPVPRLWVPRSFDCAQGSCAFRKAGTMLPAPCGFWIGQHKTVTASLRGTRPSHRTRRTGHPFYCQHQRV